MIHQDNLIQLTHAGAYRVMLPPLFTRGHKYQEGLLFYPRLLPFHPISLE